MTGLFLIASIAGSPTVIDSSQVESVIRVADIQNVPNCSPLVAGLFALRSRVLTIIDSQYLVTGVSKPIKDGSIAVVIDIAGHSYGVIVESITDTVAIDNVEFLQNVTLDEHWRKIASGVIVHDDQMYMVIDVNNLISEPIKIAA